MTDLLRPMDGTENTRARIGLYGRAGSGKTRTAIELAIGLARDLGDNAPIAMIDTEGNGADHVAPIVVAAGLPPLLAAKTRDFRTALAAMREAEASGCAVVLIDSATHLWEDVIETYQKEKRREVLSMQDWGPIKRAWRAFPDLFLRLQAHTIVCGRAGAIYETKEDEDGRWQIRQVDTKMRAEGELEHEPSLLLEMTLIPRRELTHIDTDTGYVNRATVLKDRTDSLQGHVIDFPTYADFAPVVQKLAQGRHVALDESRAARGALFGSADMKEQQEKIRKTDLLSRLKAVLEVAGLAGDSLQIRTQRAALFARHLETESAKEAWNRFSADELEDRLADLHQDLQACASGEAAAAKKERKKARLEPTTSRPSVADLPPRRAQELTELSAGAYLVTCPSCQGRGELPGRDGPAQCPTCLGDGCIEADPEDDGPAAPSPDSDPEDPGPAAQEPTEGGGDPGPAAPPATNAAPNHQERLELH